MTEAFLQYLWQYRLVGEHFLCTVSGERIRIIHPGEINTDSGPDFFNARIIIGDTIWAGNVEIHTKSSDWQKHRHHLDKAYDSVVLHVVYEADVVLPPVGGRDVPVLELRDGINNSIWKKYNKMIRGKDMIPCGKQLAKVDHLILDSWMDRMLTERLEEKSELILSLLRNNKFDWEETFYQLLARSFGFKVNGVPFEMLARSLPLKCILRQGDNLFRVEALIFGQSGLLDKKYTDPYPRRLNEEYQFLMKKYSLSPLPAHIWKFLRLRPANFPTIRLAQFASLMNKYKFIFSKMMESDNVKSVETIIRTSVSDYWKIHYLFDKESLCEEKDLGEDATTTIMINTVIPFMFVYAGRNGDELRREITFSLLSQIPGEENSVVKQWKSFGISVLYASHSQALLHLTKKYCSLRKCLQCNIGISLIKNS